LARRLAHTLRGIAGNVGARGVFAAASTLEDLIRDDAGASAWQAPLDHLRIMLATLMGQLVERLPAETVTQEVVVDSTALDLLCNRLTLLIGDSDTGALKLLEDNAAMLQSAFGTAFATLRDQLRGFDFDAALDTLLAARATRQKGELVI